MITKKETKKRFGSKDAKRLAKVFYIVGLIMFVICVLFTSTPYNKNMDIIFKILLGSAMIFIFVAMNFGARIAILEDEEMWGEQEKKIKSMLSKYETREIQPKILCDSQKNHINNLFSQTTKKSQDKIEIVACLNDDVIEVELIINNLHVTNVKYTNYKLFLETWEFKE